MLWPAELLASPPCVEVADGYRLRTFQPGDEPAYCALLASAGFADWNGAKVAEWLHRVLPEGLFFAVHLKSGALAATAMAAHRSSPEHPFGGELGWVACDPAHRGAGLGLAVCAAVVARFLSAGYSRIYLKTDDHRLPAIKSYLRLGFVPYLFQDDMASRWSAVCAQLRWAFCPERWPRR